MDKNKRYYISGPMTGYADCNRPLFNKIEEILRKFFGIENVTNPAKLPPEWTYEQWMEKDFCKKLRME